MTFQPFQQLYQHIKKTDSLLFQTLDKISDLLKSLATATGILTYGVIPKADANGNLVDSTISDTGAFINITGRSIILDNTRAYTIRDSAGTARNIIRLDNSNPDILFITNNQRGVGGKIIIASLPAGGTTLALTNVGNAELTGVASIYNNVNTIGMGVPPIYKFDSVLGSAGAIGPFQLAVGGGIAPAGIYRVSVYLKTTVAGAGNIQFFVTWSDNIGGKIVQINMAFTGNNFAQNTIVLNTAGAVPIIYFSIYAGPGTYDTYITLERLA